MFCFILSDATPSFYENMRDVISDWPYFVGLLMDELMGVRVLEARENW